VLQEQPAVRGDLQRLQAMWSEALQAGGGPFLFGAFGIADAYFAPVAFRFRTYGVEPGGAAGEYLAALLALPGMRSWEAAAAGDERLADHDLDLLYPGDPPTP
jgi:glutathione S-transferase